MSYDVMVTCRAGTQSLSYGTFGMAWTPDMHTITWCTEETKSDAEETARKLWLGDPAGKELSRVWVRERNPS